MAFGALLLYAGIGALRRKVYAGKLAREEIDQQTYDVNQALFKVWLIVTVAVGLAAIVLDVAYLVAR